MVLNSKERAARSAKQGDLKSFATVPGLMPCSTRSKLLRHSWANATRTLERPKGTSSCNFSEQAQVSLCCDELRASALSLRPDEQVRSDPLHTCSGTDAANIMTD
jgi:hypothetical protein